MTDLISRAAAIDALTDTELRRNLDSVYDGDMNRTRRAVQRVIAQLPAVDAVPVVHGRWVDKEGNPVLWCNAIPLSPAFSCWCNQCGTWLVASDEYPVYGLFCPACGARMDGERRDSE